MNETKFIKKLRDSFNDFAASQNRELPVFYKLRGSASTAGRPDILVVDAGKNFFIETKYVKVKDKIDLMEPVTKLQRTHLTDIVAAGGNAFVATAFEKQGGSLNKYGVVLILHEMIDDKMKLPEKMIVHTKTNKQGETTFELPKHSFLIMLYKGRWNNLEFFRGNCNA